MLFLTILKAQVHMEGLDQKALKRAKSNFNETLSTSSQKIIKNSYPNSTYFERTELDFNLRLKLRKLRLKSAIAFLNIEILFGRYDFQDLFEHYLI